MYRRSAAAICLVLSFSVQAAADDTGCTDDAILIFDASGSMASVGYNEFDTPRITYAIEAARTVLPQVTPYRRVGLIVYGPGPNDACSNIELKVAPDFNTAGQIIAELEHLKPDGDTPLTEAVTRASEILKFRERRSVIVLLTDGEETCGGAPCNLGGQLNAEGKAVTVHVIGFRVRYKFFSWYSQGAQSRGDTASQCLADRTGGLYVSTETTEELVAALQKTLACPVVTDAK